MSFTQLSKWLHLPLAVTKCLVHPEHVENPLAKVHMENFIAPALTKLLYRKFTDTSKENLSGVRDFPLNCYRLNVIEMGKCSHFLMGAWVQRKNISYLETCLVTERPSDLFLSSQPRNVPSLQRRSAVLLQPGTTDKWQHVSTKTII